MLNVPLSPAAGTYLWFLSWDAIAAKRRVRPSLPRQCRAGGEDEPRLAGVEGSSGREFAIVSSKLRTALAVITSLVLAGPAHAQFVTSAPPARPTLESLQALLPGDARLVSATFAQTVSGLPYLRLDGIVTVDNPGPWPVRFSLSLPDRFNGRYFMTSQGGVGGRVPDPDPELLAQGFAVAAMDRGTRPAFSTDSSVWGDPVQGLNLAHRGMHAAAAATQKLTQGYYQVPSLRRYTAGCSGGGIAGWNNMRAHGASDFDGIVIGDAAAHGPANTIQWARVAQYLLQHPEGWIAPDLLEKAQAAIIARYDGADGALDGIVQDERLIDFDDSVLREVGFSDVQIKAFNFARASWTYRLVTPAITVRGLPVTRVADWSSWYFGSKPPPWPDAAGPGVPRNYTSTKAVFDAAPGKPDLLKVDLDDPEVQAIYARPDGSNGSPFDVRKFRDGGGKMVAYYGADDPIGSFLMYGLPSLEGARALEARPEDVDRWMRMFSVPGLLHCAGGAGPDDVMRQALLALIDWVEKDRAPTSFIARRRDGRTFLLCAEPMRAVFNGSAANVNDAANWTCVNRAGG